MKIIAWNVNGLRSLLKTEHLNQLINDENPDIFCMGETKLSCPYDNINNEITDKFPQFKYKYWSQCKIKKGYSGTSIFCKKKPINIIYGLKYNNEDLDNEGRVITIELKNPKKNTKTAGYTIEERNSFNSILDNCNLIDSYRIKNPDKIEYSYWSYMRNSRFKNIGWRIDYFLVDNQIIEKVKKSEIFVDILGSDHAPIKLVIN